MKQTFTIEIDSSDYVEPVSVTYLIAILRMGFSEARMSNLSILNIKETTVEQNHGTHESIDKNALDLLRRASDSLNYYCTEINGDINDGLAMEIDNYIRENTRRT